MAQKIYDLAVKTGEYTDQQGQQKGRWQNVGAIMQSDDGSKFIMLAKWFNPAGIQDLTGRGGESILLSMFPPKGPDGQPVQNGNRPPVQQPMQQRQPAPVAGGGHSNPGASGGPGPYAGQGGAGDGYGGHPSAPGAGGPRPLHQPAAQHRQAPPRPAAIDNYDDDIPF